MEREGGGKRELGYGRLVGKGGVPAEGKVVAAAERDPHERP